MKFARVKSTSLVAFTACFFGFAGMPSSTEAQTTQAAPTPRASFTEASGPNLPAQRIGPNDLISVSVYDAPEFSRSIRVDGDGKIMLPMMKNPIAAAGLLPSELETRIAAALRTEDLLTEPNVVVTVTEYQSRPIAVTGAVRAPTTFQAIGQVTLIDALTRAGGLAPEAGAEIMIIGSQTSNGFVQGVSKKALLDDSDPKLNVILAGGEEVRVPAADHISVLGNVKTTGTFPMPDKADSTVIGALILAGGFAGPIPKDAYIIRLDGATQTKHPLQIHIKDIMDRKAPDVPLVAHDVLFIPNNKRAETVEAIAKIVGIAGGAAILANVAR